MEDDDVLRELRGEDPDPLPVCHAQDQPACPLSGTHDKYTEAHFFIEQMMTRYHEPQPFRWNLNAFTQALRSVTFRLQKELHDEAWFAAWYGDQQEGLRADPLLRAFVEGRNLVVKERNLVMSSSVIIGVFRYRKPRMWMELQITADVPSSYILRHQAPNLGLVPESHSAVGEEYGVERDWRSPELGDETVLTLCDKAWSRIGKVLAAAHDRLGLHWEGPPEHGHDPRACNLLTESDLDPSLPAKWGWE